MLWVIGVVTSLLTATYMFRLVFLTFHGERRVAPAAAHAPRARTSGFGGHAAHGALTATLRRPRTPVTATATAATCTTRRRPMALALIVLAIGSVLAGYLGVPHALGGHNALGEWLHPSFTATSQALAECNVPVALPGAPAGMTLAECAPGDAVPALASSAQAAGRAGAAGVGADAGAQEPAEAGAGHDAAGRPRRDRARADADGRLARSSPCSASGWRRSCG